MVRQNIIWSSYQQMIFDNIANGKNGNNIVVIARAGAAKTSTLIEGVKYIPKGKTALFVAFNRSIAQKLDNEISKSYIKCATLHSVGFATVRAHFKNIKLDPNKTNNIITNYLKEQGFKQFDKLVLETVNSLERTVSLCKGSLKDTPLKIDEIIDLFDIETINLNRDAFIKAVNQILHRCKQITSCVSYDDMVWFNFVYNLKPIQYDRVFIDELNDLNPAQINLAISACKADGRILAVGDPKQVCYTWAGTDIDVIQKFTKRVNAKILKLPISYRCPTSVIKLAQSIVSDIMAAPNAKAGLVKYIDEDEMFKLIKPGDFLLSRINAPLIYACLKLIRFGINANIAGRDIANGLLWLIKKSEKTKLDEFLVWLDQWEQSEIKRLEDKGRDPILIIDKAACIRNVCAESKNIDDVKDKIKELFRDGKDDEERVIASSIHRSKGLERDRVFILNKTCKPGKNTEEDNLIYIAQTRSKNELYIVE